MTRAERWTFRLYCLGTRSLPVSVAGSLVQWSRLPHGVVCCPVVAPGAWGGVALLLPISGPKSYYVRGRECRIRGLLRCDMSVAAARPRIARRWSCRVDSGARLVGWSFGARLWLSCDGFFARSLRLGRGLVVCCVRDDFLLYARA